ncbi:hypothetical protein QTP88_014284 [Uroleucon formosanum]
MVLLHCGRIPFGLGGLRYFNKLIRRANRLEERSLRNIKEPLLFLYGVSLFSFGNIENVKSVPVTLKKIKISMNEMTNAFCSCRTLWYNIKKLVSQNSFDSLRTPLERTV